MSPAKSRKPARAQAQEDQALESAPLTAKQQALLDEILEEARIRPPLPRKVDVHTPRSKLKPLTRSDRLRSFL